MEKLTLVELKALVYDEIVATEKLQAEIQERQKTIVDVHQKKINEIDLFIQKKLKEGENK